MNLLKKTIVILSVVGIIVSCSDQKESMDEKLSVKDEKFLNVKIGEFSAKEIGELHNAILENLEKKMV